MALLDYGDQLRRDRQRRRRLLRRTAAVAALIATVGMTIAAPPAPRLVWNATPSMTKGLYAVMPGALPRRGDAVIAWAPEPWRHLAAVRQYIPANVPLVKQVAAVPGDRICAYHLAVFIAGHEVARRSARDGKGRAIPSWQGCQILHDGEYLLLIPGVTASFDGRYFGPTRWAQIIGTARILWAIPNTGSSRV
jgi:conjugative transfer signal peptidase TraF